MHYFLMLVLEKVLILLIEFIVKYELDFMSENKENESFEMVLDNIELDLTSYIAQEANPFQVKNLGFANALLESIDEFRGKENG